MLLKNRPTAQIFLFCPMVEFNSAYQNAEIFLDIRFHIIPPAWIKRAGLQKTLETISVILAGIESIMLIDDCIAEEGLDKKCSALAKLAISGCHRSHSLWMTTQRYHALFTINLIQLSSSHSKIELHSI